MPAAAAPSPDELLAPGSVIDGRYRIDGVIGSGGMASVYRAEHLGIGRWVAIKVLRASLSRSREAVVRFQREAVTSGRLEHPNIVAVTDSGMLHDGRYFLVMEALDGETLADRLARDGRLPWRAALALMRGVVLGLQHAHDHGVIHRDIKPGNILVLHRDEEPLVKILDFGIAKLQAQSATESRITQEGLTIGSPAYMSPEQAADGEITPASDLYSATVVLFEMLTGQVPFDRDDPVATMKAHISAPPPMLREVAPEIDLPAGLEDIIQLGLAKHVSERVGSAGKLLGMLDRIRAEASLSHVRGARPATAPVAASPESDDRTMLVRARKPPRTRVWIALGAAALTLAAAGAAVFLLAGPRTDPGTAAAVAPAPGDARTAEPPAPGDAPVAAGDAATAVAEDPEPEIEMEEESATASAPPRPGAGTPDRRTTDASKSWLKAGNAALKAGKFEEAGASFQRALAANRNAHAALAGLAEVAYNRANFSDAVLNAKRAVTLAPAKVSYRMTLAKAYYKLLRYDDAIQQWSKVLELAPGNASAKQNIEMARAKLGR